MLACLLHGQRKKLLSLSLTLLSIAIAFLSASLIVSQNNIIFNQAVLIVGAIIGLYVILCILFPQWVGFPSLVILGIVVVFLAMQLFRFPQVRYDGASSHAVLGTCIIQVDENSRPIVSFQLIPSQQMERIQIHSGEQPALELTLLKSASFYPLYGGSAWIILQKCRSEAAELTFLDAQLHTLTGDTAVGRFLAAILGFKPIQKEQFINLDEIGKNSKQQIEWFNDSILMRPL